MNGAKWVTKQPRASRCLMSLPLPPARHTAEHIFEGPSLQSPAHDTYFNITKPLYRPRSKQCTGGERIKESLQAGSDISDPQKFVREVRTDASRRLICVQPAIQPVTRVRSCVMFRVREASDGSGRIGRSRVALSLGNQSHGYPLSGTATGSTTRAIGGMGTAITRTASSR